MCCFCSTMLHYHHPAPSSQHQQQHPAPAEMRASLLQPPGSNAAAVSSGSRHPCLRCHCSSSSSSSSSSSRPTSNSRPNSRQPAAAVIDAKGLSYLGDSIWTLCVRRHFFAPPKHWRSYQDAVQPYVIAEGQACMYDALLSGAAGATPSEQGLLQGVRAQVAGWRLRKRFAGPEGAEAYRKATAFEALIGHLHLSDPSRLLELTEALMGDEELLQPAQQPSSISSSRSAGQQ